MLVLSVAITVVYRLIAVLGPGRGLSAERARLFRNSSVLAAGWAAVCVGHLFLSH